MTQKKTLKNKNNSLAQESAFRLLFANHPIPMWVYDLKTLAFLDVNDAAVEKYGYSHDEFLALTIKDIRPPEDVAVLINNLEQKRPPLQHSGEWRHRCKNGQIINVEITSHTLDFNGHEAALVMTQDVTERKLAEEALHQSEDKFKYIFDHSVVGKSITLLSGEMNTNKTLCDMFGYTREEFQSLKWPQITHPDDVELTQNEINSLISGEKEATRFTKRFIHKNGSIVWVDLSSSLRRDQDGKPLYLISTLSDITALKQAEAAMLESKLTAERYLNIAAEIIVSLDRKGNVTHMNESGHQLLGYGLTELIGKNWFDTCLPEEERVEARQFFEMLEKGEVSAAETRENSVVTKSGERKVVLWHNTILRDQDKRFIGTLSSGEDITGRIEMEKALRIALAKYKTLFESFPLGITITDKAGNIVEANPTAEKLLAVSRDEHTQRSIDGSEWRIMRSDGTLMPPDEFASVRALNEKKLIENVEMGIIKPDQSTTWLSVTAAPLPMEGHGIVVTYSDITTRKQMEDLLQARLRISQFAESHTLDELLQNTLDEAEALTDSQIGFAHFLEEDQKTLELQMWSTNTLKNMCKADAKGRHYPVDQAGVWVECIYARAPIIHNDYASLPASRRKGMPEGHAPLIRELVVPVMRGGIIFAIFGVGNKPANYTDNDVETVLQLANLTWDIVQRKRAEEALKVSERKYRLLHETMTDGFVKVDMNGNILEFNHVYSAMLGYSEAELASLTYIDITPEKWHTFEAHILESQVLKRGYSDIYEKEYKRKDGSAFAAELRTILLRNEQGEPSGMWAIVRDITQRKRVEKALLESEARNRALVDAMPDLIFVQNRAGVYVDYHTSNSQLLVTPPQVFLGRTPHDIFPPDLADTIQSKLDLAFQTRCIQTHEYNFEVADGRHYFEARLNAYADDRILSVVRDITERKQAEKALEAANAELKASLFREKQLAHTDMLTGIHNRRHLYELAAHEIDIAARYRQPLSLILFDLDHFKKVNDTFGHTVGDQILVSVTQATYAELRSADAFGRYGGEEFVVLLPMTNAQQAFSLAERIRESVAQIRLPTPIGDAAVTLSIGIVEMVQTTEKNASLDDLIRRADRAMYTAKQNGRNRSAIFETDDGQG